MSREKGAASLPRVGRRDQLCCLNKKKEGKRKENNQLWEITRVLCLAQLTSEKGISAPSESDDLD